MSINKQSVGIISMISILILLTDCNYGQQTQINRPSSTTIAEDLVVGKIQTSAQLPNGPDVSLETWSHLNSEQDSQIMGAIARQTSELFEREGSESSVKLVLLLGALSLAPAILLMTTCYIRIIVVLTLLRQAFGGQQLPPNQVLTALSLFLTLLVMTPVWNQVKSQAIDPYTTNQEIGWEEAWNRGIIPVKQFMSQQIKIAKNTESIAVLYKYSSQNDAKYTIPAVEEVPITVLLPAFIISELKLAFLIGFQIFLPFIVLDFVVSTVTVSMGMVMLPPTMISFPLKLILFVMVDGWNLVIGMLLQSFGTVVF